MAAKTFYLDPSYARFNPDRSGLKFSTLDSTTQWKIATAVTAVLFFGISGICLLILSILLFVLPSPEIATAPSPNDLSQNALLMAGVGLASLVICTVFLRAILRKVRGQAAFRKLKESGTLLNGEVVSAKKIYRGRYTKHIFVEVTYAFTTPDGRPLTRTLAGYRPDLKDNLPQPGTPVRVLYADDSAVIVL